MADGRTGDEGAATLHRDWPLRPWVSAGLMALAGLAFYWIGDIGGGTPEDHPWRIAIAAAILFASLMLAFTLEEDAPKKPVLFSVLTGAIIGGIAWRVARAADIHVDAPFWMAAGIVSGALALPLFQSGFHRLRWQTSYPRTHFHVWTDAISFAGAVAFTGLSWLLLFLLSELFSAIRIDVLRELIDEGWFGWGFSGAAFGAALGTLRNNLAILGTLQRVVMLVFAILAVPLAAALAVFLASVGLSGLDVLWEATKSATPLLLSVAVGAFVLANAVLRDSDADMSGSRIQRGAAALLALGILPLSILAAISIGTRIAQHGLTPERIWALIAIAVAVAYGIGYFVAAILSRRQGWERLRQANLHLAVGTMVLALLLALPILDFGAISARNQVARLESDAVSAEDFDFQALRWDFGEGGRAALARLAKSADPDIAKQAREAQASQQRAYFGDREDLSEKKRRLANLRTEIADTRLRAEIEDIVRQNQWQCDKPCVVLDLGPAAGRGTGRQIAFVENGGVTREVIGDPTAAPNGTVAVETHITGLAQEGVRQTATSQVEVREWTGRRIYVDGRPIGPAF